MNAYAAVTYGSHANHRCLGSAPTVAAPTGISHDKNTKNRRCLDAALPELRGRRIHPVSQRRRRQPPRWVLLRELFLSDGGLQTKQGEITMPRKNDRFLKGYQAGYYRGCIETSFTMAILLGNALMKTIVEHKGVKTKCSTSMKHTKDTNVSGMKKTKKKT